MLASISNFQELDEYGHGMLEKPSFLALNKIDTDTSGHLTVKLMDLVKNLPGKYLLLAHFHRFSCASYSFLEYFYNRKYNFTIPTPQLCFLLLDYNFHLYKSRFVVRGDFLSHGRNLQ